MTIIGVTSNGTGSANLGTANASKLNVLSAAVLDANQQLGTIYVRSSSTNDVETCTVDIALYDITDGVQNAPRILTKNISLPINTTEQWLSFGPYTDDLSAFSGRTLAVAVGIPSAAYVIRFVSGVSTDASIVNAVNAPDPWPNTAGSATQYSVYVETQAGASNPSISIELVTDDADTPYSAGGTLSITVRDMTDGTEILSSTFTPNASGLATVSDALLSASTEYEITITNADNSLYFCGPLTTSA